MALVSLSVIEGLQTDVYILTNDGCRRKSWVSDCLCAIYCEPSGQKLEASTSPPDPTSTVMSSIVYPAAQLASTRSLSLSLSCSSQFGVRGLVCSNRRGGSDQLSGDVASAASPP